MNYVRWMRGMGLAAVLAAGLGGCAHSPATVDYDLVFTPVKPIDYARILCQHIPMQDRHTCMTSVIQHYQDHVNEDLSGDEASVGPFVMVLGQVVYVGRYVSQPLAAAFTVRNDAGATCRGRYSAFAGDTEAVFSVRCDGGRRGRANIILDEGGRNGIGKVLMDDGGRGQIAFGHAAVGGQFD